jgi:hypothetical protein
MLNGVDVITGKVGDRTVTAIPYYAWKQPRQGRDGGVGAVLSEVRAEA